MSLLVKNCSQSPTLRVLTAHREDVRRRRLLYYEWRGPRQLAAGDTELRLDCTKETGEYLNILVLASTTLENSVSEIRFSPAALNLTLYLKHVHWRSANGPCHNVYQSQ
jgi:hypothetical protein